MSALEAPAPPPVPARVRPRLWPTLALLLAAIPLQLGLSGVLVGIALFSRYGTAIPKGEELEQALAEILVSPSGLLLVMLPAQLMFLALSCGAALASPTPFRRRLGLVRWRVPTSAVAALVLATPLAQFVGGMATYLLGLEQSSHLELIEKLLTETAGPAFMIMLVCVTLGAGVTEELFFRGFVQTRLSQRWPGVLAVLVPGLFFAAIHVDPTHALAVLPIGLWMGFLALVTGSVVPAIAAHVLNNGLGVLAANLYGASVDEMQLGLGYVALLGFAAACCAYGLFRLGLHRQGS